MKKLHILNKSNKGFHFNSFIKGILVVLFFSILIFYGVVQAGTITPPSGDPSASMYTFSDIYTRLNTNVTATESNHSFLFDDVLASTGYSLTQIYNAIPTINPAKLLDDTTYLGITGTIPTQTLSANNTTVGAGYYTATTLEAVDTDLAIGNIKSGTTIFGLAGSLLPSGGNAVTADILASKTFFGGSQADWNLQTGTMTNNGSFGLTCGASDQSVTEGYYSGGTFLGDADLIAGNIASGINIFGVAGSMSAGYTYGDNNASYVLGTATGSGTALKNMYNGSATSGDYPQSTGGVDDYNAGGATPVDSYVSSWTTCDVGNSYCGTNDSTNADMKDDSTGLIWSNLLDSGTTHTWFWANNAKYPNGLPTDDGVCDTNGEVACKVVKLTVLEGKTGCEALGDGGWRLPYQKELMQVYINGSRSNLSSSTYHYWSATTTSYNTHYAWITNLNFGYTSSSTKTNSVSYRVRCVR